MTWWNKRSEVAPKADLSVLAFEALAELACSYDGYQREAAVAELVRRADPRAVALLLVRTGDWVAQVRQGAQQGLMTFMRDEFVVQWAHALPALAHAYRVRRADLGALIAAIEAFLGRHVDALEQHARTPDAAMRRWMFALRLAQPRTEAESADLLRRGLRSNELPTSLLCLKAIERLHDAALRRELLEAALRSRLPRVKTAALRELLALAGADAAPVLQALCFDRSPAVRALAVATLAAPLQPAVAARAKEILRAPDGEASACVAALHVLSLLEDPYTLAEARARTASPSVPLRRLARMLMLSADPAQAGVQLLDILADASPRVRRIAVDHVRRGGALPEVGPLLRLGLSRMDLTRDVLAMLGHGSPWDRLLFVFERLDGGELPAELAATVTNEVHAWVEAMGSCYVQPSAPQRARLAWLWARRARWLSGERPKGLLPHGFPPLVDYHLRAFGVVGADSEEKTTEP